MNRNKGILKNYIIGAMGGIIFLLAAIIYKIEMSPPHRFPVLEERNPTSKEVTIYLYVFLSNTNCRDCFEFVEVLNTLPPHFIVKGVVPESQLKDEKEIREITGATFPLIGASAFKNHIPAYTPSMVGVTKNGDVLFKIPGVPGAKNYVENFLDSVYNKLYPVLLEREQNGE